MDAWQWACFVNENELGREASLFLDKPGIRGQCGDNDGEWEGELTCKACKCGEILNQER